MSSGLNNNLNIVNMKTNLNDARHTQTVEENEQGGNKIFYNCNKQMWNDCECATHCRRGKKPL